VDAQFLDYDVLKTMVGLAEEGLPVCLKQMPVEAGYIKHPDFAQLADKLVGLSSPDWGKVAVTMPLVEGDDLPYYWCRKEGEKWFIFFAHPVAKEFRYPVKYGQAETTETQVRNVAINAGGKRTTMALTFRPGESLLLEIGKNGRYRLIGLPEIR
jgi:hypothetical protein